MSYWAVVQCESQREHTARLLLMRARFETYMPRIKHRGRISLLFPTYLFVRVVDKFYPIMWTPGVVHLLMAGDQPAQLPEQVMTDIRKREVGGFIRLPKPMRLKPGARVRVLSGQFTGHVGLYDGMSGKERERVLLDLLGRSVRVELAPSDRVEALDVVVASDSITR